MTQQPDPQDSTAGPVDAERVDPEHARSEEAAETPAHPDAEQLEAQLRAGGPLATDEKREQRLREQPTEDGRGTSLT